MTLTAIPHADLLEGVIAQLDVDAVTGLLSTDGIVNTLPQDPAYPVVSVSVRGKPVGPIAGHGNWECDVEIDAYSSYAGDRELLQILDVIAGLLNMRPMAVDGWTVDLMSVLEAYEIPNEFVNGISVKRWTLPLLVLVSRA